MSAVDVLIAVCIYVQISPRSLVFGLRRETYIIMIV